MHIFFSTHIEGNTIFLGDEESNHCKNVLRLQAGAQVLVTDGKGYWYDAVVDTLGKKEVSLTVLQTREGERNRNYYLHIAIAPTKNIDRMEWFVEKAVEIGVDEISFIQTARTERKHLSVERMEKIAVAAMKQSVKATATKINELTAFDKFLKNTGSDSCNFIAHLAEGLPRKTLKDELIAVQGKNQPSLVMLIGPEGDFTESEIKTSLGKAFVPVSLGASRLRTETAGVVACHTASLLLA